ncbi:MAG TPA: DUF883 family protein [Burkholderiales bacterium]|nr:DUF883 family protein [Burkholderiales bacterium]
MIWIKGGRGGPRSMTVLEQNMEINMEHITTEKLMQDMRVVVTDAEDLLKATAGQTGERIEKIRARTEESLRTARNRLQIAGKAVQESATEAARTVDDQVKKNPWTAVGIAAAAGLVLGILVGRR